MVTKGNLTAESLADALTEIGKEAYKKEMLVFQDMVRDVPYTELNHAAFWIEFIERHHEVSQLILVYSPRLPGASCPIGGGQAQRAPVFPRGRDILPPLYCCHLCGCHCLPLEDGLPIDAVNLPKSVWSISAASQSNPSQKEELNG